MRIGLAANFATTLPQSCLITCICVQNWPTWRKWAHCKAGNWAGSPPVLEFHHSDSSS